MSRAVLGWLGVLFIAAGGTGLWFAGKYAAALSSAGSAVEIDTEYLRPPPAAGDKWLTEFTLTERSGKKFDSASLQGQVYVVSFFFSSCPSTCLQQNQKIREIEREYGPKGVKFLSITCDPEVDSPQRLREYADKLGADKTDWLFLTGDLPYTRRIAGEIYRISMDKREHSERLFVVDKWGNQRGNYVWNQLDRVTALKLELDKLLAETVPPPQPAAEPAASDGTEKPEAAAP
ncbi:MAG: SCO family protein [Pirellulaceae bacterium]|nr:SCO family protein [Pirellulaceae bacterium]